MRVSVYEGAHVCAAVHMCAHAFGGQRADSTVVPPLPPPPAPEDLSVAWNLSSKQGPVSPWNWLVSFALALGLPGDTQASIVFNVGSGDWTHVFLHARQALCFLHNFQWCITQTHTKRWAKIALVNFTFYWEETKSKQVKDFSRISDTLIISIQSLHHPKQLCQSEWGSWSCLKGGPWEASLNAIPLWREWWLPYMPP